MKGGRGKGRGGDVQEGIFVMYGEHRVVAMLMRHHWCLVHQLHRRPTSSQPASQARHASDPSAIPPSNPIAPFAPHFCTPPLSSPLPLPQVAESLRTAMLQLGEQFLSAEGTAVDHKALAESKQFEAFVRSTGELQTVRGGAVSEGGGGGGRDEGGGGGWGVSVSW